MTGKIYTFNMQEGNLSKKFNVFIALIIIQITSYHALIKHRIERQKETPGS